MEFEENKDNIIEETEEVVGETVSDVSAEEITENADSSVTEAAPESAPENAAEETEPEETDAASDVTAEEAGAVPDEKPEPEETEEMPDSAPEEETAEAESAQEETVETTDSASEEMKAVEPETEASVTEEEPVPEENPEEEAAEITESAAEEEEEPPLVTEIVQDEAEVEPEEGLDDDAQDLEVEYETVIEEPVIEFEETAAKEKPLEEPEEQPDIKPEQSEPKEPQPEIPVKKKSGSLAVKIVGIVLLLLIIFVPAGYSLIKGDAFQKQLIDQKKSMSRSYESVYRKEIFPKLSQLFIPKWAKQPEQPEQPQGSGQIEPEPKIPDPDQPKDMLDGVPQVPEGLEYYPLYIEDHMIIYGRDNWLYTAGDGSSSLEYFAGTNVLSEEDMAYCADLLNTLDEICRAKGVELVMEVGPNKEQVYPEHFPSYTVENKQKRLLVLEEYLHEHCSAPFVYPIRELAAHKDEYDTYWMYDTHWNSTGSYIGMKAIYEALGRPITDKYAIRRTEETNRGDLAGITGYTDLYTDYITEYKPDVSVTAEVYCDWEYDIDDYGKRYISNAPNERKLLVCGDSFRVSLAEHMCKDYKYTDVIHREIIGLEIPVERLRALTEGDTLVLVCVERWDYYMFAVIPVIIEAMQQ